MPRKGLKVTAEVCISAVSCPGVRLPLEHDVFLSICLLGHHVHTKSCPPIFPLVFKEKIKFIKTFTCCCEIQQLDMALREDSVVLELVRDDKMCNKMVVLAIYETCAQNFLFPMQCLKPSYSCSDNEIILDPTNDFPGILGPKVEFSTLSTIKETTCPELDCLKDRVIQIDDCRRPCKMTPICSPCISCPAPCPPPRPPPCSSPCPLPCSSPCPLPCSPTCPRPCPPPPCPPKTPICCRRDCNECCVRVPRTRDYCSGCLGGRTTPPLMGIRRSPCIPCPPPPCIPTCPPCPTPCPPRPCSPRCSPRRNLCQQARTDTRPCLSPCSMPCDCSSDDDDNQNEFSTSNLVKGSTFTGNAAVGCGPCGQSPSPLLSRKRYVHIDKTYPQCGPFC